MMILGRVERTTLIWIDFGRMNERPVRALPRSDAPERWA
jgi:hypothetical protein